MRIAPFSSGNLEQNNFLLEQFDCDVDFFWNSYSHYSSHHSFFCVDVDEAFVDAHFPPIPRGGPFSARGLEYGYFESFRRERDWSVELNSCFLGYGFEFLADFFEFVVVCACQAYSGFSRHLFTVSELPSEGMLYLSTYLRRLTVNKNLSSWCFGDAA